ncbi:transglutaminase domain-containing protein [Cryobacterium algoricola]|uniref:Transglutaminase domain-containing protein n=1 Tax=Cryobacterium algoricola TaxID=1259183 RepID=A0ABY2IAU3_9MICO|nr:transglutaminase domain-containing protein [Cryobacterium algoricola]TFB83212.1 transglutaminase domain-containing protein [Cryobacterium algoricola]
MSDDEARDRPGDPADRRVRARDRGREGIRRSARPRSAARSPRPGPGTPVLIASGVFVLALFLVAGWAAWPIYQSGSYVVMLAGAFGAAAAIAWLGLLRSWAWPRVLGVTACAYLLLGVPFAVPSALASLPTAAAGWLELVTAPVLGWKELLTIRIPVGDYQSLLAPAFFLFLGGLTAALSLVWRAKRLDVLMPPIMFVLIVFGIVFGSRDGSPAVQVSGLSLPAPREALVGLAGFLAGFGFLVWRTREARRAALRLAARASGVRRASAGRPRRVRRVVLAGTVLLVAVAVALPALSTIARPDERSVLRAAIDPAVELRGYVSPLSQYRSYFAADRYDSELFRVTTTGPALSRVRLAVLSYYDGQVFRVIDPATGSANQDTAFARLPPTPATDGSSTATFTLGDYAAAWLPGSGALSSIRFAGERGQTLTAGYFYNRATATGVELAPLAAGDSYTVETRADDVGTALTALAKPAAGSTPADETVIPQSLVDWVHAQKLGSDGPALAELVTRLRARGYLSHALQAPTAEQAASWTSDLSGYAFEPSLAGHSTGRIGALFTALLDKQNSTVSTENADLVAGVGDDEQFAVATALLARQLGFGSRIVLGFALDGGAAASTSGDPSTGPACLDGVCLGKDLAAWAEVQGADGAWVTVDSTPQYTHPLAKTDVSTRDPQISTEVIEQHAQEQLPGNANPTTGDERAVDDAATGPNLAWLWAALKAVGLGLLAVIVVATPFVAILGAKVLRRRERRGAADQTARFAGGWDEYVDTAVDRGLPDQGVLTRVEIASAYASVSPGSVTIADLADRAVFGEFAPENRDGDRFWQLIDTERELLRSGQTRRGRVGAALSLKSFARLLGPRGTRSRRFETRRFADTYLRLFRRDENRLEERSPTRGRTTHNG